MTEEKTDVNNNFATDFTRRKTMKIPATLAFFTFALFFVMIPQGFATTATIGSNGKIEWQQVQSYKLPRPPVDIAHSLDGNYAFILTEENGVLIYDKAGNLMGTVPTGKDVVAIDIDPRGNLLYLIDNSKAIASTIFVDFIVALNTTNSPFKGNVDAPVTITVFSDFQ